MNSKPSEMLESVARHIDIHCQNSERMDAHTATALEAMARIIRASAATEKAKEAALEAREQIAP